RVGVKLIVPESSMQKALNPESWPTPIKCRAWERASKQPYNSRNIPPHITYRSHRYDESDYASREIFDEDDRVEAYTKSHNNDHYNYHHDMQGRRERGFVGLVRTPPPNLA
ncbi:unnamed protein product, partial [Owenia fusiformis]